MASMSDLLNTADNRAIGNMAGATNKFTGGFNTSIIADPYLSGYAFTKWIGLPTWIDEIAGADSVKNYQAYSERAMRNFSGISSIDLSTVALNMGFSNSEAMFASGIQNFQGFSMTHKELQGSPLSRFYSGWVQGIRDPRTNIAIYPQLKDKKPYCAENHTCSLLYVVTRPDVMSTDADVKTNPIEYACLYTMVMPLRMPMDHYNFSAGSSDMTDLEMSFAGVPHFGAAIMAYARKSYKDMIDNNFDFASGLMGNYKPTSAVP